MTQKPLTPEEFLALQKGSIVYSALKGRLYQSPYCGSMCSPPRDEPLTVRNTEIEAKIKSTSDKVSLEDLKNRLKNPGGLEDLSINGIIIFDRRVIMAQRHGRWKEEYLTYSGAFDYFSKVPGSD